MLRRTGQKLLDEKCRIKKGAVASSSLAAATTSAKWAPTEQGLMSRQNSVESLNNNSSSGVSEEDDDEVELLVDLLKRQPPRLQHAAKRPHQSCAASLFSIPESGLSRGVGYEDIEETICHRTPVTLENGYKPAIVQEANLAEIVLTRSEEEEEETSSISIWGVLALASFFLRCVLILVCLTTLFVSFVLLTHQHSSGLKEKAALGICPPADDYVVPEIYEENDEDHDRPPIMAEIESESPTGHFEVPSSPTERYIVTAIPMTPATFTTLEEVDTVQGEVPIDTELPEAALGEYMINGTITAEEEKEKPTKNKTEPEIPSFREWTQKALEEEQKKREEEKREKEKKKQSGEISNGSSSANGGGENATVFSSVPDGQSSHIPVHPARLKKNFASLDCGAKIAAANAEAQSALNIITSSRDEYMLNKCSDKVWFVVELCESIKAFKIEFANFELYSSVPKDMRITMGNVFPGRDKDWGLFGSFEAEDVRSVQTFVSPEGVFGKYVKVEINSFHGSEHYCPVSMFKIYGISEIELIGVEDDDDDDHDDNDEGSAFHMHPPVQHDDNSQTDSSSVFKMLKETFKRIAGVFAPSKQIKDLDMALALNQTSLVGSTFIYDVFCPGCDDNRIRDVYFLLAANFRQLSRTLKSNANLAAALSAHVCQSYGFNISQKVDHVCSGFHMIEFYATLFGTSRIMALCNVIGIEAGLWKKASPHIVLPPFRHSKLASSSFATTTQAANDTFDEEVLVSPKDLSHSTTSITPSSSILPTVTLNKVVSPEHDVSKGDKIVVSPSQVTSEEPLHTLDGSAAVRIEPTPASNPRPLKKTTHDDMKTASSEVPMREAPEVVFVPPANTVESHGGRESVWQKLSNKIKALERNVSLSSGYLEELSVQYKKQIEDLQLAVRQSGEALALASKAREHDRGQIRDMKDQFDQLKVVVQEVTTRMETMSTWAVGVHALFLVVEIFVGILFVFACWSRRQHQIPIARQALQSKQVTRKMSSTPLKRRHSHDDKSAASLDSNRIQELDLSKRRRSLDLKKPTNGYLGGSVEGLSRRQKKRLQRRLSRASTHESSNDKLNVESRRCSESSEWKQVTAKVSSLNNGDVNHIELGNMFGLLNNSQHDDELTSSAAALNSQIRKRLFNGYLTQESSCATSRSATPERRSTTTSKLRKSKKRSKSTSPPRKSASSVSKQKVMFEHFDPEQVDWIQNSSRNE